MVSARRNRGRGASAALALLALLGGAGTLAGTAQANPIVSGNQYMVTASHPLAARAGARMLEQGGNAVDAAVATAAAIGVVEPWFSNILGGGTWALFYNAKEGKVLNLEAVGPAPTGATPEYYANLDLPAYGAHQANIPAAFDGWTLILARYGTKSLREVLAPAIELAEKGFPVGRDFVTQSTNSRDEISKYPSSARTYLKAGKPYQIGDMLVQKDLAATYKQLVQVEQDNLGRGRAQAIRAARDFFYAGPIMKALVKFSQENKGLFTEADFAKVQARFVEPIRISYRGLDVYQNAPNSQGITMLMALNILEGYDLKKMDPKSPETIHLITEAIKLAFADRHWYVGDPDFVKVPVDKLLSKEYAAAQRKRIDMQRAKEWPIPGGLEQFTKNTTTILVKDKDGNALSITTSIGSNWVVMGDTGIVINNRMPMFDIEAGLPNQVQPGKKVRHTSNPAMALKDGRPVLLWACSGVDTQPQVQVHGFLNVVEFGMNPLEAVSAPRVIQHSFPVTRVRMASNILALEPGRFSAEVVEALKKKGHKTGAKAIFGNMNMIQLDPATGAILAGVDPRQEGYAVGW
jgi:gamma-glutamyltranspeptidase/glutathione hydrolase